MYIGFRDMQAYRHTNTQSYKQKTNGKLNIAHFDIVLCLARLALIGQSI